MENEIYDVAILGGGPAGLTAAIYAARYNLNVLVIAKTFGGTTNLAGEVENWPGQIDSGMNIMKKFKEQAEKFGTKFLESELKTITKKEKNFEINTPSKEVIAKSVIISLGTENRKLNIPGEKEFLGKGVSYCATCDGMFFKDKIVTVIGGADSAAKAALYLAEIAKKVNIIYRQTEMRCEPISLKRIEENEKIEIFYNSNPIEISGGNAVQKIKINKDSKEMDLETQGVFIEAGATPVTEIVKDLDLEFDRDYIVTDKQAKTNVSGVFAAGDCTNNKFKQIVVAAGEGALAAKSTYDYLRFEY
jgi:thioredoxin reductase (NADPH)